MKHDGEGEHCSEGPLVQQVIDEVIAAHADRHPGIIAEAIVARIAATYVMSPREQQHLEQRKNHQERIRRFSHDVYRILGDAQAIDPASEIAARVLKSFMITRCPPAAPAPAHRP